MSSRTCTRSRTRPGTRCTRGIPQRAQSYQNYHYPIFLAEVASTFNEMLLTEHLLQTTDDKNMRAYILNRQIDDLRGTLYRQTMFAEFEKLHPRRRGGRRGAHARHV